MFTSTNSLAFFCGVGAFYAQQTDQHNLFLGLVAATVGLIILGNRNEISYRDSNERADELYRHIDSVRDSLDRDIQDIRSNCNKCGK